MGQPTELRAALDAAVVHLKARQHADGWWKGELATNVTMDAEDMLLRHVLGIVVPADQERSARWIRSQQRADGGWADFPGGPGTLSTTVEAWVALRLAGDPENADHMVAAAQWVRGHGGLERARVFTHIWLALVGLWQWDECPTLPPELMFLPSWAPLNIYHWGCWARQTIVPLTIVSAKRPVVPVAFDAEALRTHARPERFGPLWSVGGLFQRLDVGVRLFGRLPVNPLRKLAMRQAAEWILARQEADGGWGGIQPPWVYSVLALWQMGYPLDHPAMKAALAGLDAFFVELPDGPQGPMRWLEACQSPVWDTGLALAALLEAGVAPDDPAVLAAADWLLAEQVTADGDWQVRRPGLPSAGWSFEFQNDVYPDTDDTAEIILALRGVDHPDRVRLRAALDAAVAWTTGMQSKDGGWAAVAWLEEHQNADGGWGEDLRSYHDPAWIGRGASTPSQTGWALLALLAAGEDGAVVERGIGYLLDTQRPDGGWDEEHYTGTGFPGFFYIGYQLYRQVFPMWALGRYARRTGLT